MKRFCSNLLTYVELSGKLTQIDNECSCELLLQLFQVSIVELTLTSGVDEQPLFEASGFLSATLHRYLCPLTSRVLNVTSC